MTASTDRRIARVHASLLLERQACRISDVAFADSGLLDARQKAFEDNRRFGGFLCRQKVDGQAPEEINSAQRVIAFGYPKSREGQQQAVIRMAVANGIKNQFIELGQLFVRPGEVARKLKQVLLRIVRHGASRDRQASEVMTETRLVGKPALFTEEGTN